MLFRHPLNALRREHIQRGRDGGAHPAGGNGHIGQTGVHCGGRAAYLSGIFRGQLRGIRRDIGALLQLVLIQNGDSGLRVNGRDRAAFDGDRQIRICKSGIRRANGLARQNSHLRRSRVGVRTGQTCGLAQAAG